MRKPVSRYPVEMRELVDGIVEAREERLARLARITKRSRRDVARFIRF